MSALGFGITASGQSPSDKKLADTSYIRIHQQIAKDASKSNPAKAVLHASTALELATTGGLTNEIIKSQLVFGDVLVSQGEYTKARPHYRAVISNPEAGPVLRTAAFTGMATSFARVSNFDSGKYFVDEGLRVLASDPDISAEGEFIALMGSLSLVKNDRESALRYYLQAYTLLEKHKVNPATKSMLLNNIGNVEYLLEHYDKAIDYATQAKKSGEQNHFDNTVNYSNKLMGRIYRKMKQHDKAIAAYRDALKSYEIARSSKDLGEVHLAIGNIFWDKANMPAAIDEYLKALEEARRIDDKPLIGHIFFALASAYEQMKQPLTSMSWLDSVSSVSRKAVMPYIVLDSYELKSMIYQASGDYKKAFEAEERYRKLNDSLVSADNRRVVDELEAKFQNAKKQREITELQKENELLALQRKQYVLIFSVIVSILLFGGLAGWFYSENRKRKADIQKLKEVSDLKERVAESRQMALRLQMNPHFIFNCISAIDALIITDERKSASEFLNKFARLLRQIMENSQHALINLEKDLACLELYIQLEQLRFKNGFEYSISVDPKISEQPPFVPPLLLQPFVENSILHGLRHKVGRKALSVKIYFDENERMIASILDNGVGRKQAAKLNTHGHTHQSMGMDITSQRLELMEVTQGIHATTTIHDLYTDEQPSGTEVQIEFVF